LDTIGILLIDTAGFLFFIFFCCNQASRIRLGSYFLCEFILFLQLVNGSWDQLMDTLLHFQSSFGAVY
jgi:hypothetical protein